MAANQLSFLLEGVYVAKTKKMGRGVFTSAPIAAGTLIELAPVVVEVQRRIVVDVCPAHALSEVRVPPHGKPHRPAQRRIGLRIQAAVQ